MEYVSEKEMYPHVVSWLEEFLKGREKRAHIEVFNSSTKSLSKLLEESDYHRFFPQYLSYDIQVDVTGIVVRKKTANLSFVECKLQPISLKDISQLLGYSLVAKPKYSLIISPKGISYSIGQLFAVHQRYEILNYADNHSLRICHWLKSKRDIDHSTLIPPGKHL
jgi:hypothetical protein